MIHKTICAYLAADPSHHARLTVRDATLDHFRFVRVWLDESGDLVMPHPTNDRSPPIAAPLDGVYRADDDEDAEAGRAYDGAQNDEFAADQIASAAERAAIVASLAASQDLTDEEIADQVGCSRARVGQIRAEQGIAGRGAGRPRGEAVTHRSQAGRLLLATLVDQAAQLGVTPGEIVAAGVEAIGHNTRRK